MTIKVFINGFGRIGRLVFRVIAENYSPSEIEIVAINDLVPADNLAYLLKYDSIHRCSKLEISSDSDHLIINGKKIKVFSEKDPSLLGLKDLDVDFAIESTGLFASYSGAEKLLKAGAKRVLISAPAKGEGNVPTFVMGVNEEKFNPTTDFIVSNASCTTNCLAPLAKVLLENFGIDEGLMTTIHSLTSTQPTVDGPSKKDWRGGRAASLNLIPSSTGAAKAVGLCLPELEGKLTGMAFRVPTADVSAVDLTVRLSRNTSYEEICSAMEKASKTSLKGILDFCEEELVSSDFIGATASCIFDKKAGMSLNPRFYKFIAWYDNEMGYSYRIVDLMKYMASRI
jgi:glyceraldehyde 3-phosphate dehydrogenase